jgi:hypothetical protein
MRGVHQITYSDRLRTCDLGVELSSSARQVQPDLGLAVTRASEKLPPARSRARALSRPIKVEHQKPQQIWTSDTSDRLTDCVVKLVLEKGRKNCTILLHWSLSHVWDNCGQIWLCAPCTNFVNFS